MSNLEQIHASIVRLRECEEQTARAEIANANGTSDYFAAYLPNGNVGIFADRHGREIIVWRHEVSADNQARWMLELKQRAKETKAKTTESGTHHV